MFGGKRAQDRVSPVAPVADGAAAEKQALSGALTLPMLNREAIRLLARYRAEGVGANVFRLVGDQRQVGVETEFPETVLHIWLDDFSERRIGLMMYQLASWIPMGPVIFLEPATRFDGVVVPQVDGIEMTQDRYAGVVLRGMLAKRNPLDSFDKNLLVLRFDALFVIAP